ncbi:substrate-binding domain-containing protein [uncultured Alsobacter sp.]|uniref:substrate-binding domain-containing protein n=1 Tax=uncultured Alsobacter sp. TaxID=1748258 RepID=UPI0025D60C4B|nr:substrate-binding domain-containing protein [uncultured Alsobacter sp.]
MHKGADLKSLAIQLGLSQSTVSRALRGHHAIPESTRRRVEAAAEAAGYRPNARARSLAIGRAETIGLVFPLERLQLPETNFVDVLAGISTVVTQRNYSLLLSPFRDDEVAVLGKLASSKSVDGVIITRPLVVDPRIALLNQLGLTFVLHGRTEVQEPYSFVDTDNDASFERLTGLLLDYGHRDIVAVNGLSHFRYAAARAAAFHRAFSARGLEAPTEAVEFVSMTEATGFETAMRHLAAPVRPTAFVCGSVFQARGVYRAAAACGLTVGRDLSVVAHDDGVRGCQATDLTPALTATTTPISASGEGLAGMLIDLVEGRIKGPVGRILPFDLILRDSVHVVR